MNLFLENAEKIFETATAGPEGPSDLTILISPDGEIHMLAGSDWPLASLEAHHGARMSYRIRQTGGRIQVEGRSRGQACLLESVPPAAIARRLLADRRRYLLSR